MPFNGKKPYLMKKRRQKYKLKKGEQNAIAFF